MISNQDLEFKEKFDPALIPALYRNFKSPTDAILELVDNAIDDRIPGEKMIITVDLIRDGISIVDKGGFGMGPKELDSFFVWGLSKKRGKLGRYGQGGKAAMGYLGKSWKIRSTKKDEEEEYLIKEPDWDDRTGGLKKYKPEVRKTLFIEDGVVQIDIWHLKRKVNKNELRRALGTVYRPLIKSGKIEILSNGPVTALEFPLEMPEENFIFEIDGYKVKGWLGFLKDGSKMRGGIRCYAYGRLIFEREFFGQKDPTYKESINRLIGEVNIDFDIPLVMNKTDFDRGSPEWKEIEKEMFARMDPYISLLLEEREKDLPTEKELKAAEYAGEKWKEFLKYIENLQKEGRLPGLPTEIGQKPQEPQEISPGEKEAIRKGEEERKPYQPATPPPVDAVGKRKRTGAFPRPVLRPLPEYIRYQPSELDGERIILINTKFPIYRIRKNQLPLYIWETLIFEYARAEEEDTQTVVEYIEAMNVLLKDLARFIKEKNIKVAV